jgi:hypothetical protein
MNAGCDRCGTHDRVSGTKMCHECNIDEVRQDKWERVLIGEKVVATVEDMRYFESQPDEEVLRLASIINPNRVGDLDTYIAYLK